MISIQNLYVSQMSKFANQISKVDGLELKYPHLYKLSKEQLNFKEKPTCKDTDYICSTLERLQEWTQLL